MLAWAIVGLAVPEQIQTAAGAEPKYQDSYPVTLAHLVLTCVHYGVWPEAVRPATQRVARVGVLGEGEMADRLRAKLEELAGKPGQSWFKEGPIQVLQSAKAPDLKACHVVFVALPRERDLRVALETFKGLPVVLMGDREGFLELGGTLEVIPGERLRYALNLDQMAEAKVSFESQLRHKATYFLRQGEKQANPLQEGKP